MNTVNELSASLMGLPFLRQCQCVCVCVHVCVYIYTMCSLYACVCCVHALEMDATFMKLLLFPYRVSYSDSRTATHNDFTVMHLLG